MHWSPAHTSAGEFRLGSAEAEANFYQQLAGELLREMRFRPDVPEDLKQQAHMSLRHYPYSADLLSMVQDVGWMSRDSLDQHWLAPEAQMRIGCDLGSREIGQSDDGST